MSILVELLTKDEYIESLIKKTGEKRLRTKCKLHVINQIDRQSEIAAIRFNVNADGLQEFINKIQFAIDRGDNEFTIDKYEHDIAIHTTRKPEMTEHEFEKWLDSEYHSYLSHQTWCIHSSLPNGLHPQTHKKVTEDKEGT